MLQRVGQIDDAIQRRKTNRLPGPREPILPRLAAESEADTEVAETVVFTSSESEAEPVTAPAPTGVRQFGRYSIRVTTNNPLLRSASSSRPASSSTTPTSPPLVLPRGVEIEPNPFSEVAARFVLGLDWHQVLDVVRLDGRTLRPSGYYLLNEVVDKLQALKQIVPDLIMCINSYCHCEEDRLAVLGVPDTIVNFRIVTNRKDGVGGTLDALRAVFGSEAGIVHIDDNYQVVQEIFGARNCKALGILIPRRGRRYPQQRFSRVTYYQSVVHALDHLIQAF